MSETGTSNAENTLNSTASATFSSETSENSNTNNVSDLEIAASGRQSSSSDMGEVARASPRNFQEALLFEFRRLIEDSHLSHQDESMFIEIAAYRFRKWLEENNIDLAPFAEETCPSAMPSPSPPSSSALSTSNSGSSKPKSELMAYSFNSHEQALLFSSGESLITSPSNDSDLQRSASQINASVLTSTPNVGLARETSPNEIRVTSPISPANSSTNCEQNSSSSSSIVNTCEKSGSGSGSETFFSANSKSPDDNTLSSCENNCWQSTLIDSDNEELMAMDPLIASQKLAIRRMIKATVKKHLLGLNHLNDM